MPVLFWVFLARTSTAQPADAGLPMPARSLVADNNWTGSRRHADTSDKPTAPARKEAGAGLRLVGVMASGDQGLALIAGADGVARLFRVGAVVHGDTVLKSVSAHEVRLGPRDGFSSTVLLLVTAPSGINQPVKTAQQPVQPVVDGVNDTSPIVPPHTDMATPRASESGTAGSHLREIRAKSEALPGPAGDALAFPAPR